MLEIYRKLPKESFELLIRNISVRGYLEEIWNSYERFESLREEKFEKIFEEVFRFFFRPFEAMLLNEKVVRSMVPLKELLLGKDVLTAYTEFLKSLTFHSLLTFQLINGSFHQKNVLDKFFDEWEEFLKNFESSFEISVPEFQFLLPENAKNYLLDCFYHWRVFLEEYENYRRLLKNAYSTAVRVLIDLAEKNGFRDFDHFRFSFQEALAREFDLLLKSEEYLETQGKLMNSLFDHIYCLRRFLELLIENNPASPFATVSQIDEAYKRIWDLRRKIAELERRIERLEGERCSKG